MTTQSELERPKWQGPTTEQIVRAAVLCYLDDQSDEEIAARLGICRRTLARWKLRPDFAFAEQVIGEFTFEQTARGMVERWRTRMGGVDRFDRAGRPVTRC